MLLPEILKSIPPGAPPTTIPERLRAVFEEFDAKLLSDFTENFRHALRVPIMRRNIITKKLREDYIRSSVERVKSGTTALVAYVDDGTLYLANTGDCRAGKINCGYR